jgi:flagellar hook-basal body complex protein FliE
MSIPITAPSPIAPVTPLGADPKPTTGSGFETALAEAVRSVEAANHKAAVSTEKFLSGEDDELHEVAIAMQKASIQFDTFLQVRNKVVQAYQEVMRMQL